MWRKRKTRRAICNTWFNNSRTPTADRARTWRSWPELLEPRSMLTVITPIPLTISATEGIAFSGQVATFTDSNLADVLAASITWGDGNSSAGTISGPDSGGTFTVGGTHTYAEATAGVAMSVVISDAGGVSATAGSTADVKDAPVTASGIAFNATEGSAFSGTVATFTDADPGGTVSDYAATIAWGDGVTSAGTITTSAGGGFAVIGSHVYSEEATEPVTVNIADGSTSVSLSVGANVNIDQTSGDHQETTIAVNPTNPLNLFACDTVSDVGRYSMDGGKTWSDSDMSALTPSIGDVQAVFDKFGNLFLTQLDLNTLGTYVARSSDGGKTFGDERVLDSNGSDDQPSIAVGPSGTNAAGAVWVKWTDANNNVDIAGAPVSGFNNLGTFGTPEICPGPGGDFGFISVGPNGQVMVSYQDNGSGSGPDTIKINVDPDGLGPQGPGNVIDATTTNVGGFSPIPPQPDRTIDAEPKVAFDRSGGPHNGRVYLVYVDRPSTSSNDTDIYLRYSDDNGATWSNRVRLNDDPVGNGKSQLQPAIAVDQSNGDVGVTWYDARNSSAADKTVQVFGTASVDGGQTWLPNVQISKGTIDPTVAASNQFNLGDYDTMSFVDGVFYRSWADNSNSTGDNPGGTDNTFDAYTAPVTLGGAVGSVASANSTAVVVDAALTGTAIAVAATEGVSYSGNVATFTDNDPAGTSSDYTATIDWGDQSSLTTVNGSLFTGTSPATGFTVPASHFYSEEGSYTLTVTIADNGGATAVLNPVATVGDPSVVANLISTTAVEASASTIALATFSDPGGAEKIADYSASIDWGDGSATSNATISLNAGVFTISGNHAYAEEGTMKPVITVSHGSASPVTATASIAVTDQPVIPTPATLLATEGTASTFDLATFTDPAGAEALSEYSATIDWGDGTVTKNATISLSAGAFTVIGRHLYAEEGAMSPAITINHDSAAAVSTTASVLVSDVQVTATGATLTASEGTPQSLAVATFVDPAGPEAIGDYDATIDWGDGTTDSHASISLNAGVFTVSGQHAYAEEGSNTPMVTITHGGLSPVTVTAAISVSDPSVVAVPAAVSVVKGTSATLNVATFTDPGGAETIGDYAATIDWGDGTTVSNASISLKAGIFTVSGTHDYPNEADETVVVSISHDSSTPVTVAATVSVGDAPVVPTAATLSGTEGSAAEFALETFIDPSGAQAPSSYLATIDWGDGTVTSNASVTVNAGTFTVSGTHTYSEEGAMAPVVTIKHDNTPPVLTTASINVSDPAVVAIPATLSASEGAAATFDVATFIDPAGAETTGDYSATIGWGDGTFDKTASLSLNAGVFTVSGLHAYAEEGSQSPRIVIAHDAAPPVTITASISVSDRLVVISPVSLSATEGAARSFNVATFTDPGGIEPLRDYSATIDWGDGTVTRNASIVLSSGVFTVSGTHAYVEEGSPSVVVTIAHDSATPTAATESVAVSDPAVIATPATRNAVESVSSAFKLATFTDPAGAEAISDYSATIAWGDGSTSDASLSFNSGIFTVSGTHAYAEEGANSALVTIQHDVAPAVTVTAQVSVSDPAVDAVPSTLTAVERQSATMDVATFTDPAGAETIGDYRASVDWGDGMTTNASIVLSSGVFTVSGSHAYAEEGSDSAVITIAHDSAIPVTVTAAIAVSDPGVVAQGRTANEVEGTSDTFTIATFTDPGGPEFGGNYSATIDWGDGTTTSGAPIALIAGVFTVIGTHDYAEEGVRTPLITIDHASSTPVTATASIAVSDPSVVASAQTATASEGAASSMQLATFVDPAGSEPPSEYAATITWGDGTSSSGTITLNSGTFTVNGSHAYAEEGSKSPQVVISHASSKPATVTASVSVADLPVVAAASSLTATEGAASTFNMATFTDPAGTETGGDYSATIDWGDGTTTTNANIVLDGSIFTVSGTHAYSEDGTRSALVTISHDLAPPTTVTAAVSISDPSVVAVAQTLIASEQTLATFAVATFTDPGGTESLDDYSATIDWGDGSVTKNALIALSSGVFTVSGTHMYAEEDGESPVVTIRHDRSAPATITASIMVSDPQVDATAGTFAAVEGATTTLSLATFTDPPGAEAVSDYTAMVAWGDGTTSDASITLDSGVFTVSGAHAYVEEGRMLPAITIAHGRATPTIATATVEVSDPALAATAVAGTAVEGTAAPIAVATFSDPGGAEPLADYNAAIAWGNGPSTGGATITLHSGVFTVSGVHAYAEEGSESAVVTLRHDDAPPVTVTASIMVSDAALVVAPPTLAAGVEGSTGTFNLAYFSDPGGIEPPTDYTATIDWGDGTPNQPGSIDVAVGGFVVSGSHSYAEEGNKSSVVIIEHDSASPATATASIQVSDRPVIAAPAQVAATTGNSASVDLATFTDPAGAEAVGDYAAMIDWGDGSTSSGTVTAASGSPQFTVSGGHDYADTGTFQATVTIVHDRAAPVAVADSITVAAPIPFMVTDHTYVIGDGTVAVSTTDGVLSGDTAPSRLTLTAGALAGPGGGTFAFDADGSFAYTPSSAFSGYDSAQVTVSDSQGDHATVTVNVLSQPGGVVWKFYESVLNRTPDPAGLQYWTNYFNNGGSTGDIAYGFFESDELLDKVISSYYEQYLLRPVDAVGLAYWQNVWHATGGPEQIKAGFAASSEFYNSAGSMPTDWIAQLYVRVLGRTPDAAGAQFWLNNYQEQVSAGVDPATVRYTIALGFLTSAEAFGEDVTGWFAEYLFRVPTGAEKTQYTDEMLFGATDRTIEQEIASLREYATNPPQSATGAAAPLPDYYPTSSASGPQSQAAVAARDALFSSL